MPQALTSITMSRAPATGSGASSTSIRRTPLKTPTRIVRDPTACTTVRRRRVRLRPMGALVDRQPTQGQVLWTPPADARERFELGQYLEWLRAARGLDFTTYPQLWHWSVSELEAFWASIWDYFGIRAHVPYDRVLGAREMPGAEWFPGARLNFAEHMLGRDEDVDRFAVVAHSQTREPIELTFGELRDQVARARAGLQ